MESSFLTRDLDEMYDSFGRDKLIEIITLERSLQFKEVCKNEVELVYQKYDQKKRAYKQTSDLNRKELKNRIDMLQENTFLKPFNIILMIIAVYLLLEYKNNVYFNPVLPCLLFLCVFINYLIRRKDLLIVKQKLNQLEQQYTEYLNDLNNQERKELRTIIEKISNKSIH
jgi:amino acid permease